MSWWGSASKNANDSLNYPADVRYHGLYNQGATCYLNSVLQALFMTRDFREAVRRSANDNPELAAVFDNLEKRTTNTYDLTRRLSIHNVYEQQDAAEYLERILKLTSQQASKIFCGWLAHTTTCRRCGSETKSTAPFWHLPLPLNSSSGDSYSVEHGVAEFFKTSEMSGDNQVYCESCDAKADAAFKMVIEDHPDVLVLLLKRFDFSYQFMSYVKNNQVVQIPDSLPISEAERYELYAVVEHFGDLKSGHYCSKIRIQDGSNDRWFEFEDTRVAALPFQPFQVDSTERSENAYLLFYRKPMLAAQIDNRSITEIPTHGGVTPAVGEDCSMGDDPAHQRREEEEEEGAEVGGPAVTQPVGPLDILERAKRREKPDDEELNANDGTSENERRLLEESVKKEVISRFQTSVEISEDETRRRLLDVKEDAGEDMSVGRDAGKPSSGGHSSNIPVEGPVSAHGGSSRDYEERQSIATEGEDVIETRETSTRAGPARRRTKEEVTPRGPDPRTTAAAQPVTGRGRGPQQSEVRVKIIEEESREMYKRDSLTEKIGLKIIDESSQSLKSWCSDREKASKETEVSLGHCSSETQQKRSRMSGLRLFGGFLLETGQRVKPSDQQIEAAGKKRATKSKDPPRFRWGRRPGRPEQKKKRCKRNIGCFSFMKKKKKPKQNPESE